MSSKYNTDCTFFSESTASVSSSSKSTDSDCESSLLYPHYDKSDIPDEEYDQVYYEKSKRGKNSSKCYSLFDRSLLKGAALVREQLLSSKEPLLHNTSSSATHNSMEQQRRKNNKNYMSDPIETKKSRSLIKKILHSPKSVIPADESEDNMFYGYSKMLDSMKPSLHATELLNLHDNEAYLHACRAGKVWQSLIGQFIRFPPDWKLQDMFNNSAVTTTKSNTQWKYISRSKIRASEILNEIVPNPCSPGRVLLHISVKDLSSSEVSQEFVIGVSHPKHILDQRRMIDIDDDTRLVWMALREKNEGLGYDDCTMLHGSSSKSMSLLRPLLGKGYEDGGKLSPLGNKKSLVSNNNIRTVSIFTTFVSL